MRRASRWTAGVLLWVAACVATAAGWDENRLMQALAQAPHPTTPFTETRHLNLLDVPLQSHGELEFRAPDYLRRSVAGGESFEIDGGRLVVHTVGGEQRELSLDSYPGLRAFAESFRATLAGDLVALHRYFRSELHGTEQNWELRLVPTDAHLGAVIARISLFGHGGRVTRVETYERGGDYTVTRLGSAG